MDEALDWLVGFLASSSTVSALSGVIALCSFALTAWDERRKRIGVFATHRPDKRVEDGVYFEVNIQNFNDYALDGPIYVFLTCSGIGHAKRGGGHEKNGIRRIRLFAGPSFSEVRHDVFDDRKYVVIGMRRIDALRTIGMDVVCDTGTLTIEVRGDLPDHDKALQRVRHHWAGLRWPVPLCVSTGSVASVNRYPRSPSWWLFAFLLAGGLSGYWFLLSQLYDPWTLGWNDLGWCVLLTLVFALVFWLLRRDPMPVARGYREGFELELSS